ncbi:MAG: hypothetical protein ACRENZ_03845, partial [Thermodesulfobacteriota bacterium]
SALCTNISCGVGLDELLQPTPTTIASTIAAKTSTRRESFKPLQEPSEFLIACYLLYCHQISMLIIQQSLS